MLPSHCGILAELISIASTSISLQQRQSVSLASFLQCPHLQQLRFPILICNNIGSWSVNIFCFFSMALISTRFFLFRLKLKWLKNGRTKVFIVTCIFFRIISFFIKYKSDNVFSVFLSALSLDQNLIKVEKQSNIYLFSKCTKKILV